MSFRDAMVLHYIEFLILLTSKMAESEETVNVGSHLSSNECPAKALLLILLNFCDFIATYLL